MITLEEQFTDIVFHMVNDANSLLSILRSDIMELRPSFLRHGEMDMYTGNNDEYFLSVATSITSQYILPTKYKANNTAMIIILELDGRKLSQKFKGKPLQYWDMTGNDETRHGSDEMEIRLLSRKSSIQNFHIYIRAIHVYKDVTPWTNNMADEDVTRLSKQRRDLESFAPFAMNYDIPIYLYPSTMALQARKKGELYTGVKYEKPDNVDNFIKWGNKVLAPDFNKDKSRYDEGFQDFIEALRDSNGISADLHNLDSSAGAKYKKTIEGFGALMKKAHTKSLRELVGVLFSHAEEYWNWIEERYLYVDRLNQEYTDIKFFKQQYTYIYADLYSVNKILKSNCVFAPYVVPDVDGKIKVFTKGYNYKIKTYGYEDMKNVLRNLKLFFKVGEANAKIYDSLPRGELIEF